MGLIKPRPEIKRRTIRAIETRLRVHAALMAKLEAEDHLDREAASSRAFDIVKGQTPHVLAQIAEQYGLAVSLS